MSLRYQRTAFQVSVDLVNNSSDQSEFRSHTMTVVVLKRTSDKLDAFLSGVVLLLGVVVLGVYLSAPRKERRDLTII